MRQPIRFGEELRRRRLEAGLSLGGLARLVHYSKGQLSKIERGIKTPSRELVRLCDAALGAHGSLAAMVREEPRGTEVALPVGTEEEVWLMGLSADGQSWFQPVSRRHAVAVGAASIVGMSLGGPEICSHRDDSTVLAYSRSLFTQYRQIGQAVNARLLLPALIAHTHMLRDLSARAGPPSRQGLLRLGSRYAEYVGWLVQEAGDDRAAMWWTRRSVEFASAGGDHDFAAHGLVRRALTTLYREDAEQTIDLARRAQSGTAVARIRGLAAQREAQGHALAGDYDACMRSLDRARSLLASHPPALDGLIIGTSNLTDPAEMIKGWCLYDLGRPRAAAEVIDAQLAPALPGAVRTRVRYGVRGALAYAAAGEIDHACELTRGLLTDATALGSATVATDLRKLAHTFSRHPRNASVRDLAPELGTAVRIATPATER